MTEELQVLCDIATRLDAAGIDYMLTGSVALNSYAQPRMTRDIDLVVAFFLKDVSRITDVLGLEYYVSEAAAREAVLHQSSFNAIHERTLIKVDFMVRKREDYRLHEFTRRVRPKVAGFDLWVVSKEDLILSKLHWAKESLSERQLADVENLIATGMRYGVSAGMVSQIEPDRYADTGFAVKDTPPEINARLFAAMMRKTPEERLLMGLDMMATARELVSHGLQHEAATQSPEALARLTFQRLHGVPLPW
jgi:hypothetical protein